PRSSKRVQLVPPCPQLGGVGDLLGQRPLGQLDRVLANAVKHLVSRERLALALVQELLDARPAALLLVGLRLDDLQPLGARRLFRTALDGDLEARVEAGPANERGRGNEGCDLFAVLVGEGGCAEGGSGSNLVPQPALLSAPNQLVNSVGRYAQFVTDLLVRPPRLPKRNDL